MPRPVVVLAAALVLAAACSDPAAPTPPDARPALSRLPVGAPRDDPAGPARIIDYHFMAWTPLGDATFEYGPAATEEFDLARGPDSRLYLAPAYSGKWTPIADEVTSRPAATAFLPVPECVPGKPGCPYPTSTYAIAARRGDANIWIMSRRVTDGAWTAWQRLPAGVFGAPAIAFVPPYLYVVVRALDGTVKWSRTRSIAADGTILGSWSPWLPVPGATVASDPAAFGLRPVGPLDTPTLHIYAKLANGQVWRNRMADRGVFTYTGWQAVDGAFTTDAPAISGDDTGYMILAVRGLDGAVWYSTSGSAGITWSPFLSAGGETTSPPAVHAGRSLVPVRILARGLDSRIWQVHSW